MNTPARTAPPDGGEKSPADYWVALESRLAALRERFSAKRVIVGCRSGEPHVYSTGWHCRIEVDRRSQFGSGLYSTPELAIEAEVRMIESGEGTADA